ncbi:MAG: hypothetical protein COA78_06925 [Blastopirellula sp.]|nr:MAG: hypothetical protein COA78_06925 [Blastopirellula sp.]
MRPLEIAMLKATPLGEQIIIAGDHGEAYRYDITSWTLRQTYDISSLTSALNYTGQRVYVDPINFAWFVVMAGPETVAIDMESGAELYYSATFGGNGSINADGTRLCIANNSQMRMVDTTDWSEGAALNHSVSLYAGSAFSPNDTYIAIGGYNGLIRFFTWADVTLTAHTAAGQHAAWYASVLSWLDDNNLVYSFSTQASGGFDENRVTRRSAFGLYTTADTGKAHNDFEMMDFGAGWTTARGMSSTTYGNPRVSNESLKYINAYNGSLVVGAFTADAANYPVVEYVQSIALSSDQSRAFYASRFSAINCKLREFNPVTMEYMDLHLDAIGGSTEDIFGAMRCFSPDA